MIRPPPLVALMLRDHLLGRALQAEEHALGVDPVDTVPIRLAQLHDRGIAGDPGIVDDDVEPAELGDGARHHPIDAGDIAAIGLDRDRPPRVGRRLGRRALRRGEVDVGRRDRRPGRGHRQRRRPPDPGPGAGHQHDFVLQHRHRRSSSFSSDEVASRSCHGRRAPRTLGLASKGPARENLTFDETDLTRASAASLERHPTVTLRQISTPTVPAR